jgi:glucose-1-phosphate adenylyltransferase
LVPKDFADAVRQCMPHFLNHDFDYALILSGDQLYQMDFNDMIEEHIKSEADYHSDITG